MPTPRSPHDAHRDAHSDIEEGVGLREDLRQDLHVIAAAARTTGTGASGGARPPAGAWLDNRDRISAHARRRRRRRLLAAPVAAAVLLAGGGLAAQQWWPNTPTTRTAPAGMEDSSVPLTSWRWAPLPAPPLAPRSWVVTAWTGSEALFLGGSTKPCPPSREGMCSVRPDDGFSQRDGMAYNPATGGWRSTAPAPQPIIAITPHTTIGDRVYVLTQDAVLVYDAAEDSWGDLPLPPEYPFRSGAEVSLVPFDGKLVALAPTSLSVPDDPQLELIHAVYDPADGDDGEWTPLPDDPLDADSRVGLDTPHGLLLLGTDNERYTPGEPPPLVRAALLDPTTSTWRRLPDSDQLNGYHWTWTGSRAIDATPGASMGSDNVYGRLIPNGGALTLPEGTWSPLPEAPGNGWPQTGWPVEATGGARGATNGFLYDDTTQTWITLPPPKPDLTEHAPGPAVWTSHGLVVLGSGTFPKATDPARTAWIFQPPR
ncbi:hypothetical protein CLV92_11687 [Kineococcus xinjiangensis]|uniref:Galactose oxidase-like protein n=1 Tax=Kineococcus xinjiangensis TaxID=512762 RepID=A0A2S6IDD2_9ACTN|nr:hypothetical protein [Kineococcus xinjiangensis]PPK92225.1 hypothetical protein CLV92_11687 [Kineococcus xinjiangensis]